MHVFLLSEITKFNPVRYFINIDILVFLFVFFNFLPIILFSDLVHLCNWVTFLTYCNEVIDGYDEYA